MMTKQARANWRLHMGASRTTAAVVTAVIALLMSVVWAGPASAEISRQFTGTVDSAGTKYLTHQMAVAETGPITAELRWPDTSANLNLLVYRPDGSGGWVLVAQATSKTANPERVAIDATVTGTWRIGVKAVTGASSYTLDLTVPGSPPPAALASYTTSFGFKGPAGEYSYGMDYDATDNTILVGDVWNYRIKRYTTSGQFIGVVSQYAKKNVLGGTGAPFDVEADPDGDVWSADQSNSRIVEFDHNGKFKQTIGMGGGPEAHKNYPQGCGGGKMFIPTHIAVHPVTGSVYDKFIYVSDVRCRNVYVFDHDGRFQFEFTFDLRSRGVFTPIPRGIGIMGDLVYVVEHNSRCIVVFDRAGNQKAITGCQSDMNDPRGLEIDEKNKRIYVVAAYRNEAFQFDVSGTTATLAKKFNKWGTTTLETIRWPAVDSEGNVYIGDTWQHTVRKFDPALDPLPWATPPQTPPDGGWNQTNGIGIDQRPGRATTGWMYGIDHFGNRAQAFQTVGNNPATGQPWSCTTRDRCDAFLFAFGGRESVGQNSEGFTNPATVTVGDGYVWADGGHAVLQFDLQGKVIKRFGSHGKALGQFGNGPLGIRVLADGDEATADAKIYTTDATMCRIQVFDAAGTLLNHSGSAGCGNASPSQMLGPRQLDVRGNLVYVADAGRSRIAVWDASTSPMTYVTAITTKYGDKGVSQPRGVVLDPSSNKLYIGDSVNRRVVRVDVGANGVTFTNPVVVTTGADTPTGNFKSPEYLEFGPDGRLFVSDNYQRIDSFRVNG